MVDKIKAMNIQKYILKGLLLISFAIVFYPVLVGLVRTWNTSEEYSHGFFIIPISLFIIWQKKQELLDSEILPSWIGLVLVILILLFYIVSQFAGVVTLSSFAMVLSLFGMVLYLCGFQILRILLFPFSFLFLMIPVPAQIYSAMTIPLQLIVSKVSVGFTHLLQLPVFREGNVIHMPGHTLQVVEACSGLRSMISLLTLSAIFGYVTLRSNILRGILFVTGVPVAVLVNIVRVVLMIFAFHFINFDLTEGTIHTIFGVVIFILALIIIAIFGKGLSIWDKPINQKS